jgi:hypothetical protein
VSQFRFCGTLQQEEPFVRPGQVRRSPIVSLIVLQEQTHLHFTPNVTTTKYLQKHSYSQRTVIDVGQHAAFLRKIHTGEVVTLSSHLQPSHLADHSQLKVIKGFFPTFF